MSARTRALGKQRSDLARRAVELLCGLVGGGKEVGRKQELQGAISAVIDQCVEMSVPPAATGRKKAGLVTSSLAAPNEFLGGGRVTGAESVKFENMLLNVPKLLASAGGGILGALTAGSPGVSVASVALAVLAAISDLRVKLTQIDAVVLWTMWMHSDENHSIPDSALLGLVNAELRGQGHADMDWTALSSSLDHLEAIHCVEKDGADWRLLESITLKFQLGS